MASLAEALVLLQMLSLIFCVRRQKQDLLKQICNKRKYNTVDKANPAIKNAYLRRLLYNHDVIYELLTEHLLH